MPLMPTTGGGIPPLPTTQPPVPNPYGAMGPGAMSTPSPFAGRNYNDMIQSSLDYFMNPNSEYMQAAKQAGMQVAAERGGVNSSIAAGASQKAALEQATSLASSSVASQLGQENAQLQDWMDSQSFNRSLAAMPYQSSMDMLKYISQAGIQDPALYTPSVISGFSNFYNQNMNDILKQYFGP